ncbi:MAG: SRPBCC family protein [Micropruina sp.]|uniref:SRPBCC family protein n=1 Tax=Micropruina sp. TaxID=2737536 RepID=UPI0039E4E812
MDIESQIDAVDRAVASTEDGRAPLRVQTLAQSYPAPLADVWDAVTTADRIARWFLPVEGELVLGGRYQLQGNAGGTVLECEPPAGASARFRVSWEFGGGVTWLTVRLQALDAASTRLELEHAAPVDAVPEELWNRFGPGATGLGWDAGLLGLSLHLTAPEQRPEDPMAWQLGPEGRRFNRLAADRWALAHIADGADPEVARAAADAVYAMYVGEAPL